MSWWKDEYVFPVSAKSTAEIAGVAELVVREFQEEALSLPQPIDLQRLVDYELPKVGVHFVPVGTTELPDSEAETKIAEAGDVEVLIRRDQWDELFVGGRLAHRARASVAHELGHVVLHVPEIRRRARALRRASPVKRTELKAFLDPEWQAWTFALALLMPLPAVKTLTDRSPSSLSATFQVSEDLAATYLKRFKRFL